MPSAGQHLRAAARSVHAVREKLTGIANVEWVVCVDGPGKTSADHVGADRVVRLAGHRGVSTARNAALTEASGDWVFPLDADDLLVPDGFFKLVEAIQWNGRHVGWIGSNRTLLDGSPTTHWFADPQRWEAGEYVDGWFEPGEFHSNNMAVRRQLALQAGGWPATGASEDLAFLLAVSELAGGIRVPTVTVQYRTWEGQTTKKAGFRAERDLAFELIAQTVNARREAEGRPLVVPPAPSARLGSEPTTV